MEMKPVTKIEVHGLMPKAALRFTQIPGSPALGNGSVVLCGVDMAMAMITAHPNNVKYVDAVAGHPKVVEAESDVPSVVNDVKVEPVATEKIAKPAKIGKPSNKNMAGKVAEKSDEE